MITKKIALAVGLFTSMFALGVPRAANATTLNVTCNVSLVAWAPGAGGEVQVNCGNVWYYGDSNGACGAFGVDSAKEWQSMAQASLLSGKKLYIEYNSGTTCITYERLTNQ
ncbi:MAG TPA: hypothetical protein VN962_03525 [Polyangia bacterium]|nr:hypothetical protein [Polyangia bacterium]